MMDEKETECQKDIRRDENEEGWRKEGGGASRRHFGWPGEADRGEEWGERLTYSGQALAAQ